MSSRLQRQQLHTVQLVQITAYDTFGEVDQGAMRTHAERLYEAGIRVFIPCAGSSEFHSLMPDEIVSTIASLRAALGDEAVIVAPTGLQPRYAADLGKRSIDAGADAILVMPLSFPYLSDDGAGDYFLDLMQQVDCPTLVYKKSDLPSDQLLLELADHPNLIGVKYAVNDLDAFQAVVQEDDGRIDWYCGSAERFSPFFALAGSPGYTSGAGNLCPRITLGLHAALAHGDWGEAMRLQKILLPIERFRARSNNSYNISMLKYAMHHVGLDFGDPRAPFRKLTLEEEREIDQMMRPIMAVEAELSNSVVAV